MKGVVIKPTVKLPLPESGKISSIIHLSDIHIRTGDLEHSRYKTYEESFKTLYSSVEKQDCIIKKEAVIIITGDFFESKNKIESPGILLFNNLLKRLSSFAPVYLIQGNHDYRQDQPNNPDILTSLLHGNTNPNIYYISKTGCYVAGNLGFGLVSVRDTLIAGNTFGQLEELPTFPNKFPPIVTKKIALFHGSIINSTLQNYTSLTKGYPLDWFKGYDLLLLGDIHLQQIHGTDKNGNWNKDLVWGYPGSLIQQNFGEHLFEHGYFIWDLENKTTKAYNIKSSFGFLTVKYEDEWKVKIGKDLVLLQEANIPDNINIRISGKTKEIDIEKLKNQLDGKKYNISSSILNVEDKQEKLVDVNEIATCNSSDSWINYIEKYHLVSELEKYNWKSWFRTPETFNIDLSMIDASIIDSLDKRNEAIIKKAKSYLDAKMSHDMNSKKTYFYLSHMKWSWLLSYQKDNWFDFSKVDGKIATLNAPNGSGKSSFLEIICLGVFGKSPPSRINSDDPSSIINCYKPFNEKACVEVVLNINQNKYLIKRTYNVTNKMKEEVTLYENDIEINSGHKAVDEWVSINIGKFDSFLLTSMLTQNSDKDFFSLNKKDQIDLFNKALNVDSITALEALMKETMLAHTYLITKMEGIYASLEEISIPESSSLDNDHKISEIKTKLVDIESKKKILIKPNIKNYSIVELLELKKRNLKEERNLDSLIEFRGTIKNQIDRLGIYPSLKGDKIEEMIDISTIVTRDIDEIEKDILDLGSCLHSKEEIEEKIREYKDISKPEYQIEDYEKWEKEKNLILKEVEVVGIEALRKFLEKNPVMLSPLTKEELDKRITRLDKERIVCEEVPDVRAIEKKKREEYENLLKIAILDIEKPNISREELLLKIDNSLEDNISCSLSKEEIDKRKLRLEKERVIYEEVLDVRDIEKKKREEYEDLLKVITTNVKKPTISREELLLKIDNSLEDNISCSLSKEEIDKRRIRLEKERVIYEEVPDVRDIEKKKREEYEDLLKISILDIEKPTITREELSLTIDKYQRWLPLVSKWKKQILLEKEKLDIERRLEKLKASFKYNPDCWACKEQPLRKQILEEEKRLKEIEEKEKIESYLEEFEKIDITHSKHLLKQWDAYDDYNKKKDLVLKRDILKEELVCLKEQLDRRIKYEYYLTNKDRWEEEELFLKKMDNNYVKSLLKQWDDYIQKKEITLKRDVLKEELTCLKEQLDRRIKYEYYLANKDRWEEEELFLKKMDNNYIKSLLKQWDDYIQKKEIILKRDILKEELICLKEQLDRRVNYEYYLANKDRWEEEELFLEKIEKMIESYPISKETEDLLKRYDNINEEVWLIRLEKIKRYENKIYWENQIKRLELEVERNNFYRKVGISKYFKEQLDGQLIEVEEKIERGKMFLKLKDFQMMEKFLIEEKEQLSLRQEELSERKSLSELEKIGERIKMIEKNIIDQKIRKNEIALKIDSLNERNEVLKYLKDTCVKGYRSYLYNDIVLPKLLSITNNIVSDAVENNNTMLTANYDEGRLIFGIKRYEEESITIEKCGGFHRFIYGLGMRIALNSMGASGVLCSQLFLDEGFVSADSDNLSRIPNFLRKLIGVYKGILVVSHLEILKECGDIQANIRKGYLRF